MVHKARGRGRMDMWSLDGEKSGLLDSPSDSSRARGRGSMPDQVVPVAEDKLDYEGGGLARETNWWGAFVVGLAGVILVTGIAPVMVTSLGAASIPLIVVITIMGYLLCLMLAELSAMMPERTGGAPSYVYPAMREKWPRAAKHANGLASWMYWLGWFPVAPLNMIL